MKEYLYSVSMMHKKSGERVQLDVWAYGTDDATHKVVTAIGGYHGEYEWRGTSPVYRNNQQVGRIESPRRIWL